MCFLNACGGVFCFKEKTADEMRISDWSSDVCSSDLRPRTGLKLIVHPAQAFLAPQLEEHIEDTGRFALAGQRGAQRLRDLAQSRAGRIRRATHCRIQ